MNRETEKKKSWTLYSLLSEAENKHFECIAIVSEWKRILL